MICLICDLWKTGSQAEPLLDSEHRRRRAWLVCSLLALQVVSLERLAWSDKVKELVVTIAKEEKQWLSRDLDLFRAP